MGAVEPRVVVVFGDSITAGSELPAAERSKLWLHLVEVQAAGQFVLVNEGKAGRPTDSLQEFEAMLQRHPRMDALMIALGTNDSRDVSDQCVPKATAHLDAMIARARQIHGKEVPVWIVAPPNIRKDALKATRSIADQRVAKLQELGTAFSALAEKLGCNFISLYGVVPESSLTRDGVHPDGAGNERIASVILRGLLAKHPQ